MSEPEDFVVCRICGKEFQRITHAHLKTHTKIFEKYQSEFPEAPTISEKSRKNNSMKRPEIRAKISASVTEHHKNLEYRAKQRARTIEQWKDPKYRASMTGKNHPMCGRTGKDHPMYGRTGKDAPFYGRTHTEEHKAKMSVLMTGENNPMRKPENIAKFGGENNPAKRPEVRAKISEANVERWKDPEYRDKMSASAKKQWKDLEFRANKMGKNHPMYGRTGENSPAWKDGSSFLPYCHLFNKSLKEQARNRYGRVCALTNLMRSTLGPDAGLDDFEGHEIFSRQRLAVHHIYGNKMAGCDGTELVLIPLQGSYNGKKFDGLKLEDHPFYITLFMFKDLERRSREQCINGG